MGLHSSSLRSASLPPMLLVFIPAESGQYADIEQVLFKARSALPQSVRILRIREVAYPAIVRSFRFTSLPAFSLLQQGLELWRYSGPIDTPDLVLQLSNHLEVIAQQNHLAPSA